jgi:Protein NO VEIN, C-terminal
VKDIAKFAAEYDSWHEATAFRTRGVFINKFPVHSLKKLTLDEYVVGHGDDSFCNLVESRTKAWANIQGANSFKFGIYFGKTKTDSARKYRFIDKFGTNERDAFAAVKAALIDLVALGGVKTPDFVAIDKNPLSQMFKAKILSLYYPERFLAVCSSEHLEMLGNILGFPDDLPHSQYQHLLLAKKRSDATTRKWSEPKFMAYLYKVHVRAGREIQSPITKPRKKKHRHVDFEEMQRQRAEIGRQAEEYALAWEKERLTGARLGHLIDKIEDRREYPGYGHDFLSYCAAGEHRFIEVKCVAKIGDGLRFFLSDNEHQTSLSTEHAEGYYFYLVLFDGRGKPSELLALLASKLYENAEMSASSYEVRFDKDKV